MMNMDMDNDGIWKRIWACFDEMKDCSDHDIDDNNVFMRAVTVLGLCNYLHPTSLDFCM